MPAADSTPFSIDPDKCSAQENRQSARHAVNSAQSKIECELPAFDATRRSLLCALFNKAGAHGKTRKAGQTHFCKQSGLTP